MEDKRRDRVTAPLTIVGIEPGFSGALGSIGGHNAVIDMPVIGEGAQKMVDGGAVYTFLRNTQPDVIVIEQVSAMPGQGVATMFRFGSAYGAVCALALATSARVILVPPAKWKKKMGLIGRTKEASRALAIRLFPDLRDLLKRKKDDGRSEALLIAEYYRVTPA